MDCLFCKIAHEKIAAQVVYEDDNHLAFLDINPVTKGHTLVIPKKHADNFSQLSNQEAKELAGKVHQIARPLVQALGAEGYNLGMNNGPVAGQIIDHVHWHIIPRYGNDNLHLWQRSDYEADLLDQTFEKLQGKIK
ncbi:MAG: hypothetical protein COV55_04095 [Candidatus Komeilibacteria bacterium CG11_big_fil_rev_8_21_14_0_20_36_20]|uniref:HIT domain-containing protein n=1 Tax=Candidatus Komeilibacteria bacterium CG11_big_fil_rev_8_21_14_0_20_36_20 TaxID=1974477 RepID=A0A2H0NC12_9BACT|nr:MAG: hypothetical protein COV55_04095 [Candidatus Komeilibacteria bacterium CG11_big_fil_rev_8_21_14_0_20_36_20]PIR82013.1 MAG: HIT family protein [Candidatus Komeilibacteria bacterium CG10_big_fil_rev_8_21_14_0_10_36_65]PJC55551.1 MAG: HIT family protein [Candidatus Komeilibacteria bacterium CG_4_9_14_0_2_um_filter_36_13]